VGDVVADEPRQQAHSQAYAQGKDEKEGGALGGGHTSMVIIFLAICILGLESNIKMFT
jgi:hypothetical protein